LLESKSDDILFAEIDKNNLEEKITELTNQINLLKIHKIQIKESKPQIYTPENKMKEEIIQFVSEWNQSNFQFFFHDLQNLLNIKKSEFDKHIQDIEIKQKKKRDLENKIANEKNLLREIGKILKKDNLTYEETLHYIQMEMQNINLQKESIVVLKKQLTHYLQIYIKRKMNYWKKETILIKIFKIHKTNQTK